MISHDKFIDKIKQYIDEKKLFSFGDHVIIGLSGGADSVCLLLALKRLQQIYNLSITAIHVHHGIRGESAEHDLKFSRQLCEKEEIEFVEKRCDVPALAAKHHLTEDLNSGVLAFNSASESFAISSSSAITLSAIGRILFSSLSEYVPNILSNILIYFSPHK